MHTTVLFYSAVGGKYKDNPGIHIYIPIHAEATDKGMKGMQTSIGNTHPSFASYSALTSGSGLGLYGVSVSLGE